MDKDININDKGAGMTVAQAERLQEIKQSLENEDISWGELSELENLAEQEGIDTSDMMADEVIDKIIVNNIPF